MRVYLWSMCVCVCVCVCIERPAAADWGGWEARGKMKCHKQTHIWNMYLPYVLSRYTGWPRLIGSRKLHIIIHKRATKYTSLLRKMTCKDKGSYESSPLCNWLIQSQDLDFWIQDLDFWKEPYKRDNILQKRPIILSILLTVATPYHCNIHGSM